MLIAVIFLLGYGAGRPLVYDGAPIPMALLTALAFLGVTSALLVAAGAHSRIASLIAGDPATSPAEAPRGVRSGVIAIAVFLVSAIAGSGIWYFRQQQAEARGLVEAEMAAIADLKVQQVVDWRAERMADAWYVLRAAPVTQTVTAVLTARPSPRVSAEAVELLTLLKRENRYERVEIFDVQLRSHLVVPEAPTALDSSSALGMKAAMQMIRPVMTDLHLSDETGLIHIDLLVPVLPSGVPPDIRRSTPPTAEARPVAVVLFRLDPRSFLFPLIQSWPKQSRSAETYLVRREGDDVLFLSDLRLRPDTSSMFRLPLARGNFSAAQAARGYEGVMQGLDYRGAPVVAATRKIPDSPWAIVAEIDQSEIYAPFRQLTLFVGLLVGVAILASGLGVGIVWRHQSLGHLQHALALERRGKELAERMAYLTRLVNDVVLLADANWKILEANDRALETYGYTLDELQQLTLRDLRPREDREAFERAAESVEELERGVYRTVHLRKDGTRIPVEISVRAVEFGGATYYQSVIRDISERVRAEIEIMALNAELEQRVADRTAALQEANGELQTFTFSVSHDLKAPLRGMDGYSRLLLEEYGERLDPDGRFYVQNIRKAAGQMSQLIDDLLKYSRIERGMPKPAPVNPRVLVEDLVRERNDEVHARAVEVVVDIPCEHAMADPDGIRQVLRNLIDNALKFTRDASFPRIEVGGRYADSVCQLWVRDNGCGFDMRHQDRIFEIFQRLHRAEDYPGTGVGLAIVRKALQRMGGRAWAESEMGKGATFYIEVPR